MGWQITCGRKPERDLLPAVSVIRIIEWLSNKRIPQQEWEQLQDFIQIAVVYALNDEVVQQTINRRQNYKQELLTPLLPLQP